MSKKAKFRKQAEKQYDTGKAGDLGIVVDDDAKVEIVRDGKEITHAWVAAWLYVHVDEITS